MAKKKLKIYKSQKEYLISTSSALELGKPEVKLIEAILTEVKNQKKKFSTSYRDLSDKTGLTSFNAIQKGLSNLEEMGFIKVNHERGSETIIDVKITAV